ncbi:two component transcriptional regulator, LuxR family [Streptoalloteichus tenebrarius]|uniref:Two component transcriptional regulator, LuxR family n=1 Tax=Streptoalloteichus tenebrarius (strain ATCC 17920 / DSM 40477 / JCM 4838 / CBS 697.72 / NBRC 16177 / NCIMB 11028 / NRRL B-12390 / A12253. 1 / ISP 5477) TaxID=1933 RepID=A0ABT1HVC8_STRSD|nr:response regulator transcription factor [Streptoalloteichus tenebrarius]MCP2259487.1 two component transcriptional regulator, LuxR family [Streptoalloteichus tenebrarius]BFF01433.1 response regulator transcription factor [Streptoalloteichus tenebrarius]
MIRLLLVDDEHLIRGAVAALLALEPDIDVVAQVADGPAALSAARALRPDVAVLDLEMPGMDGVSLAEALRAELPDTRVVIVTRHARPGVLRRALSAGVLGFVPKTAQAQSLADVVRQAHAGRRYVDPGLATEALLVGECPLTPRELDVLREARDGAAVSAIARKLNLSAGTVRNYLSSAMSKLDAETRFEAARRAWELGWL